MARKLAFVLALIGLCLATAVYALGLGSIQSDSSLNEPLAARVPLLGVDADEATSVSVSLASPEAFERAGVDRPFSLSRLDFEVKRGPEGAYIEVTTEEAVKEPFLDFLVEVRWPQGKLVREYTLLLDPPTYAPGEEAPATQAPAVAGDGGGSEPQRQPETGRGGATGGATASGAAELGAVSEVDEPSVGQYRVEANDTLWEVAQKVRPDGSATVNQTMLALLRENPDAFIDGDMNRLKRGSILRVPERGEISGIPVAEANAEVRRQIAQWQRNRGVAGDTGDAAGAQETAEAPSGEAQEQTGSELRVVAPEEGTGEQPATSAQGEGGEALQQEVTLLKESNASLEAENQDLKAQVEALKREVAQLESSVNVQTGEALPGSEQEGEQAPADEPAMDAQGGEEAAAEEPAEDSEAAEAAEAPAAEETVAEGGEPSATEQQDEAATEPGAEAEQQGEEAAADGEQPAGSEAETAQAEEPAEEAAATAQPEPAQKPEPRQPKAEPQPTRAMTPFWQDPMIMGLAGAVVLVLLLLVYMVMRRRGGSEDEVQDLSDQIAEGLERDQAGDDDFAVAGGSEEPAAQAETADEEAPELPPESDPLGEAEVYLAYGRYDQAQEVLERGLQRAPNNKDLRLKMLEVLALTQDRGAFEDHAQQLHSLVDDDDPVWARARELGREVAPEHPLFAAAGAVAAAAGSDTADEAAMSFDLPAEEDGAGGGGGGEELDKAAAASDDFADFDFSFDDGESASSDAASEGNAEGAFDLDFDLSEPEAQEASGPAAPAEADDPAAGLEDLGFDLDEAGPESPATQSAADESAGGEDWSLDLDLDDDQPVSSPSQDGTDAGAAAGPDQDVDGLGDFDFDFEDDAGAGSAPGQDDSEAATKDVDMQSTALDYNMDESTGSAEPGGDDVDMLDEVGTKLDLARAYMDMGDSDGARALLDEVVEEGNDAQIKEARELIAEAS